MAHLCYKSHTISGFFAGKDLQLISKLTFEYGYLGFDAVVPHTCFLQKSPTISGFFAGKDLQLISELTFEYGYLKEGARQKGG